MPTLFFPRPFSSPAAGTGQVFCVVENDLHCPFGALGKQEGHRQAEGDGAVGLHSDDRQGGAIFTRPDAKFLTLDCFERNVLVEKELVGR